MTLALIAIAIGSIGIGALMAAAFGIPEDNDPVYAVEDDGAVYELSPTQEEVARWQEATDRTFARQGIRRVR